MHVRTVYKRLSALLLLTALLALPACDKPKEPIRVGFLAALTGRGAELGQSGRNGALLAVEEINLAGGIDGRPIELLTADTGASPEQARAAFDQLDAAQVVALIGPMLSQTALVLKGSADQARIVMLAPTVSTPELSGLRDHFYRIYPTADITAPALADFAWFQAKVRDFAIIQDTDNTSFTRSWVENFSARVLANGGSIVTHVRFSSKGQPSIHALTEEATAGKVQGVLILANSIDTGHLTQQLKLTDPDLKLFASEWSTSGDLLAYGGRALEGMSFIATYDTSSTSLASQTFNTNYQHRFERVPLFAAQFGYEAMQVLATALHGQAGKRLSRQQMDRLGPLELLNGTIRFDANGDVSRDVFVSQIQEGRFKTVARVAEAGAKDR